VIVINYFLSSLSARRDLPAEAEKVLSEIKAEDLQQVVELTYDDFSYGKVAHFLFLFLSILIFSLLK